MDLALEEVEKHCHEELQGYFNCLEKSKTGLLSCNPERLKIRSCAVEKVEIVRVTSEKCKMSIQTYDTCLATNPDNVHVCLEQLRAVKDCIDSFDKEQKGNK